MTTEEKAAAVLATLGTVRNISAFGRALLDQGVMRPAHEGKLLSAQGCALLAGRWLRRLEVRGLAFRRIEGWRAASSASSSTHPRTQPPRPATKRDQSASEAAHRG